MEELKERFERLFGDLIVSVADAIENRFFPPKPDPEFKDPLNLLTYLVIKNSELDEVSLLRMLKSKCPDVQSTEAHAYLAQIAKMRDLAYELGSAVNGNSLKPEEASRRFEQTWAEPSSPTGNIHKRGPGASWAKKF